MQETGKVSDTVYKRSVQRKTKGWPLADGCHVTASRNECSVDMAGTMVGSALAVEIGYDACSGACAVHQSVNRLAAAGGKAYAVTLQVVLPTDAEESAVKAIFASAAAACKLLQIAVSQSDAFYMEGMTEPLVTAVALGVPEVLFKPETARANQDIIMTGYAGWRGAVKLAATHAQTLQERYHPSFLAALQPEDAAASVFSNAAAVEAAVKAGVRTMYATGEGGIFTAVWELAEKAGLGASVHLKAIPLRQEAVEICDYLGVSPYQLLTEGALLLAVDHGQKVLTELAAAGIPAAIIGHLTDNNDRVIMNEDETRFLEPFRGDSLTQGHR